ncbi:MAG: putative chromosome-partitioning protein ParB [Pelotomaculum sp. PtaB.Bin104]|nr:MAG: putative chromosome-partitioning protein ParB [Pelotomaculum sp. PtaB.Bin104]
MSKRRGLGKGLGAIIPGLEENIFDQEQKKEVYKELAIEKIKPANSQPRQMFDEAKLAELAASIKEHGVIQPVVVRQLKEGEYELIAGERRWRACLMLGQKLIPAVIKEYQDMDAHAVSLIENVQREDLNPLEEALAYKNLIENFGLTQDEVSGRVGKSRPFVANMVRLLGLPLEIQDMLAEGRINTGHARALLSIRDSKKQLLAAKKIARQQLSVRQAEKIAQAPAHIKDKGKNNQENYNHYLKEVEESLNKYLGTKVRLKEVHGGGGKLEINFSNEIELKRIIEILLSETANVSRETFA